jgi:hypothetical protein
MESGEFFFELDNRIYYGFGWTRKIADLLEPSGFNRVDVLVDEGVKQHNPYFEEILEVMQRDGREIRVEVLRGTSEPDYDYVDSIADLARRIVDQRRPRHALPGRRSIYKSRRSHDHHPDHGGHGQRSHHQRVIYRPQVHDEAGNQRALHERSLCCARRGMDTQLPVFRCSVCWN